MVVIHRTKVKASELFFLALERDCHCVKWKFTDENLLFLTMKVWHVILWYVFATSFNCPKADVTRNEILKTIFCATVVSFL